MSELEEAMADTMNSHTFFYTGNKAKFPRKKTAIKGLETQVGKLSNKFQREFKEPF